MSEISKLVGHIQESVTNQEALGYGSPEQQIYTANQLGDLARDLQNFGITRKNKQIRDYKAEEEADDLAKKEKKIKDEVEAIRLNEVFRGVQWENIKDGDQFTHKQPELIKAANAKRLSNGELRTQYNFLRAKDKVEEEQAHIEENADANTEEFYVEFLKQKNTPKGIDSWPEYASFMLAQHQRTRYRQNLARVDQIENVLKEKPFDLSKYTSAFAAKQREIITQNQDLAIQDRFETRGIPSSFQTLDDNIKAVGTKPITTPNGRVTVISNKRAELGSIRYLNTELLAATKSTDKIFDTVDSDGVFGEDNIEGSRILFSRPDKEIREGWIALHKDILTKKKSLETAEKNIKDADKKIKEDTASTNALEAVTEALLLSGKPKATEIDLSNAYLKLKSAQEFFGPGKQTDKLKTALAKIETRLKGINPLSKDYDVTNEDTEVATEVTNRINKITSSTELYKQYNDILTNKGKNYKNLAVTKEVMAALKERLVTLVEQEKDPEIKAVAIRKSLLKAAKIRTKAEELAEKGNWTELKTLRDSTFEGVRPEHLDKLFTFVSTQYGKKGLKTIQTETKRIITIAEKIGTPKGMTLANADKAVLTEDISLEDMKEYYRLTKNKRKDEFENKGLLEGLNYEQELAAASTLAQITDISTRAAKDKKLGSKAQLSFKKYRNTRVATFTDRKTEEGKKQKKIDDEDLSKRKAFQISRTLSNITKSSEIKGILTNIKDPKTIEGKGLQADELIFLQGIADKIQTRLKKQEDQKEDSRLFGKYTKKLLNFEKRPTKTQLKGLRTTITNDKWSSETTLKQKLLDRLLQYNDSTASYNLIKDDLFESNEKIRNAQDLMTKVQEGIYTIKQKSTSEGALKTLDSLTEYRSEVDKDGDFIKAMEEDPLARNWSKMFSDARADILGNRTEEELKEADKVNFKKHEENKIERDTEEVTIRQKIETFIQSYDSNRESEMRTLLAKTGVHINRQGHLTENKPYLEVETQVNLAKEIDVARIKDGNHTIKSPTYTDIGTLDKITQDIKAITTSNDKEKDIETAKNSWREAYLEGKVSNSEYDRFNQRLNGLLDSKIRTVNPTNAAEDIINDAFLTQTGTDAQIKQVFYNNKNSQVLRTNILTHFREYWQVKSKELSNKNASKEEILGEAQDYATLLIDEKTENHPMGPKTIKYLQNHYAEWDEISDNKGETVQRKWKTTFN